MMRTDTEQTDQFNVFFMNTGTFGIIIVGF